VDEKAWLQTAFTPVIRRPYLMLDGKLIVSCGDSVFLNDPITGQGCNTASFCAEKLYEILMNYRQSSNWDERLGEDYWNQTRPYIQAVTEWTNAMMGPLPESIVQTFFRGAEDQSVADQVAAWFSDPHKAHAAFFPDAVRH
jgi:flavin-dependent dehydrogenase